jgi:two-component system, chemotaxis family, sensor kinase CheA
LDSLIETFFMECDELLEVLASGLRDMDADRDEIETVHSIFRAVHSIKGAGAAFGLKDLVRFTHCFETALDLLRTRKLEATNDVMSILHRSSDFLADLVVAAREKSEPDQEKMNTLITHLERLIGDEEEPVDTLEAPAFTPILLNFDEPEIIAQSRYKIDFYAKPDLYRSGNEPSRIFRALNQIGQVQVSIDASNIPPLSSWSSTHTYLNWSASLETDAPIEKIRQIFEFVTDCSDLNILPIADIESDSENSSELMSEDVNHTHIQDDALASNQKTPTTDENELTKSSKPSEDVHKNRPNATIRVGLDRVDKLMNMIGELVIKEAMLSQVVESAGISKNSEVTNSLDGLRQLAGDIQESVMAIRAQPLKLVFQRMHRILREAADATGKQVVLVTKGESTEVDKTMIEHLIDPLTHMIRNSVDHGLEDPETRLRRGKPSEGTITISAAHRSGRVLIEVSDDGGGINQKRVRQVAEQRGLIDPDANLSPAEVYALLFLPGFSSSTEVSALSGRGVGLDVVRREIMSIGGRVMIKSNEGQGTTFSITLPLTLAVLEGMLIHLRDQTMVLPITAVQETLRPTPTSLHSVGSSRRLLSNRGELIPIIDVACIFGLRSTPSAIDKGVIIVVETDSQKRAALLVDGIFDQRQVVIKSLEENYGQVLGVSAATILGDGKISLIIDTEEIVQSSLSNHMLSSEDFI